MFITDSKVDNKIVGRAALWPVDEYFAGGVICAKGLRVQSVPYIVGSLDGDVTTVARELGDVSTNKLALRVWAEEQRALIEQSDLDQTQKARSAEIILECGAGPGALPLARFAGQWLTSTAFVQLITAGSEIAIIVGDVDHEDYNPIGRDMFTREFRECENAVFVPTLAHPLFARDDERWRRGSRIFDVLRGLIERVWEDYEEYEDSEFVVGRASYEDIIRSVTIYQRSGTGG